MLTTVPPSCVEPHFLPSASVTASSIASETATCQAFEPTPLQPLVVVAEACCLLGTSIDIDNSRFKAESTSQSSLLISQQQLLGCTKLGCTKTKHPRPLAKVESFCEPLGCFPPPAAKMGVATMRDANDSALPDFDLVMDFFDSQAADDQTKAGLYRCAMGKRLPIKDKLAMMQHAITSTRVICGLLPQSSILPTASSRSCKPYLACTATNLPSFIREHANTLSRYLLCKFDAIHEYELQLNAKDVSYKQWCPKFQLFVFAASESFGPRLLNEIRLPASTHSTTCATTTARRLPLKLKRTYSPRWLESEINRLRTILHVVEKARRRWKKAFEKRRNR
jgi:hypothetical protein